MKILNRFQKYLFILFLLLFPVTNVMAQQTITGTVTDSNTGDPLVGVNILVKGTTTGTVTNADGHYSLTVPSLQDSLRFSYIGYQTQTVPIVGRSTIVVVLSPTVISGQQMVVIGYGESQRKYVTGSISSIEIAGGAETRTVTSVGQLLQGQVPGLLVGMPTGPRGDVTLRVRGQNSINAGKDPLIVVDGVPYDGSLSNLNPNDIASIDVLKGASAAAVYGASAANGVILVTTKRGHTAKPTVQFKSSVGFAKAKNTVVSYSPSEYIRYMKDASIRLHPSAPDYYYANPTNLPSDITLEEWKALGKGGGEPMETWLGRIGLSNTEIQNYLNGKTINWYDKVYRDYALRQNYDISISGKPEYVSYYFSLGYVNNEAQVVGGGFRTVRARMNLSATPADWFKVQLHSWYTHQNLGYLGANAHEAVEVSPYGDMFDEDGSLKWYPHDDALARNPFLTTKRSGRRIESVNNNLRTSLRALLDLPFGLGYEVWWTNNLNFRRGYRFVPSTVPNGRPAGKARRRERNRYIWRVGNMLTWHKTFSDIHTFNATLLYSVEAEKRKNTTASNSDFPIEYLGYGGLPLGTNPSVNSNDTRVTGTALMGRLNYRLLDRYLFTVSYRRDGYSAFGQNNPYAYFPSAAFAWRISEEPFFDIDAISNLKLRLSWGVNGNRSIGPYVALQQLYTAKYIYGKESVLAIGTTKLANHNLKWERTTQYNAGLDFGLFNGRFSGSIDTYYTSTTNLLLRRSLPSLTGYRNIWANLGEVVNWGLEIGLNSINVQSENFTWESTLNFSLNRNRIKHLYGTQVPVRNEAGEIIGYREADDRSNGWFIGHALHQIYNYKVLGVWQMDEAKKATKYGKEPGDFKLLDVNGDGVILPLDDKVFQGYTRPRYRVSLANSFHYKNFSAYFMLTSYIGDYTAHNIHIHGYNAQYDGRLNQLDYPYWTHENPTNEWARLASQGSNPSFNYWEETSFVRLQNVSLTYRIPEGLTSQLDLKSIRVFLNARNVLVFTGYDGLDPQKHRRMPQVVTLGINLTF